ncbi:MAG: hypothetical protein ACLUV3_00490 [Oscillospiraceae bacterium]
MDKEKLIKAENLNHGINDIKFIIGKINDIESSYKDIYVTDYNCSVAIPPELKNVLILLLKSHYEEALQELEQEFKEL